MEIVYLLIPVAIILVAFATWAFFYSVNSGQFDDLESPAHRILYDDDDDMIPEDARVKKASSPQTTDEQKD
jgi:cbb3-type cytochrome oxidase maturation protein